jgi:uncharacterized protein
VSQPDPSTHTALQPVTGAERIASLDVLRGFAVLGILVMNIQSFAMVDPTYFNPTVSLDLTGINLAVWWLSHVLVDSKFMAIFSILFGAGIVLACSRFEQRGGRPAQFHYRRTFGLLLFGVLHAYLLWSGDILVWYSMSAIIAYLFWRTRPGWLLFWALALLLIGTGLYLLFQWSMSYWPPEAIEGIAAYWNPPPELIQQRLDAYRGGWLDQMSERVPTSLMLHTFVYLIFAFWRTLGMMLLGMAFFKWGILTAQRSNRFYIVALTIGFAIGFPIVLYGALQNFAHDWDVSHSMFVLVATGYISVIMLLCRSGRLQGVQDRLTPVGRTAFTGYILQTLICTSIFFGHGFGLYGSIERWQQALIVVAVWIAVILFANLWLAQYRMGPLEWLWRTLTYGARQPFKR